MPAPLKDPSQWGGGTVPVTAQIDQHQKARLMELAHENDRTLSAEVRRAIGLYLFEKEKEAGQDGP